MISSAGVGPIVHFHSNINASVYKELLHQHVLPHLRKGTVETPIFMQDHTPCHKAKTVKFSWRGINSCHEVATTKSRYESSRECMENHRGESSEQKSSKYWWFMGFSERRMGKYHYNFCKKLICSCSQTCNEVIRCKGKVTKYWIFL